MFVSADDDDDDGRLTLQLGIRVSSSSSCVSPSPTATINPSSSSPSSSSECSSTSSSSLFAPPTTHDDNAPVVGWPPVRRTHTISNRAKLQSISSSKTTAASFDDKNGVSHYYVKVNMDGYLIGRKINLASFDSYETLAQKLEDMFFNSQPSSTSFLNMDSDGEKSITTDTRQTASKLLMGSSEFVLTFEDKEGDWMLVGDVPWRMFCNSVKRLRIMRTSAATATASMPVII